jgi:hypothetical protein
MRRARFIIRFHDFGEEEAIIRKLTKQSDKAEETGYIRLSR